MNAPPFVPIAVAAVFDLGASNAVRIDCDPDASCGDVARALEALILDAYAEARLRGLVLFDAQELPF